MSMPAGISNRAKAAATTSGPIPAGSPRVMTMRFIEAMSRSAGCGPEHAGSVCSPSHSAVDHRALAESTDPALVALGGLLVPDALFDLVADLRKRGRRAEVLVGDDGDGEAVWVLQRADEFVLIGIEKDGGELRGKVDAVGFRPLAALVGKGVGRVFLGEFGEVGAVCELAGRGLRRGPTGSPGWSRGRRSCAG